MIADSAITETSLTGTPMAAAMITEAAQKLQKPLTLFTPCPPASDRESWEKLSEDLKARLIKNGEQYLHYEYPSLTAEISWNLHAMETGAATRTGCSPDGPP